MLKTFFSRYRKFNRAFSIFVVLALLISLVPVTRPQAQIAVLNKLSAALQQELNSVNNLIWSDASTQRVRVIVQTNGLIFATLMTLVNILGGNVLRRFSSINGMLVEVPESSLLTLAEGLTRAEGSALAEGLPKG